MPRTPLRIADLAVLNAELAAWANATNADERQVDWRFTASDARCISTAVQDWLNLDNCRGAANLAKPGAGDSAGMSE